MSYLADALLLLEEKQQRIKARSNFLDFVKYTKSDYVENWHHWVMAEAIQKFIDGSIKNLIISAPPRHGKSELVSRRLPAYILGINPEAQIISTNYNDDLSQDMSRDVQRIIDQDEYYRLFPGTTLAGSHKKLKKNNKWRRTLNDFQIVDHTGIYRAAGIRAGITGKGCDYLLIDDYIKNFKESKSKTIKNEIWNEYINTLLTRLQGKRQQLITATRWANDDLIGRTLKTSTESWTVINFEAIKTNKSYDYDPRTEGEALWPWRAPLKSLITAREINPTGFITLYQGYPPTEGGFIFKSDWWTYYDQLARGASRVFQSWDTAFKEGQENDYSVCTTWQVYIDGYYLLDVFRKHMNYPALKKKALELYYKYAPNLILIEDKASGQSLIQDLRNTTLPIVAIKVDSDKITRATAISGLFESGKVKLPVKAPWLFDYTEEFEQFCQGCDHDDQVDSTSQFLNYIKPSDIVNDIVVGQSQCNEEF